MVLILLLTSSTWCVAECVLQPSLPSATHILLGVAISLDELAYSNHLLLKFYSTFGSLYGELVLCIFDITFTSWYLLFTGS